MVAKVHHSRIIRLTGRELPYLERSAELYWGESEVESLYKDVVAHDNVSANMAALTFRANINTMEVQNLDQLFSLASGEAQRRFWNVMQAQSVMMSNFGYQLVNKGDQMTNTQYSFGGLQEVYEIYKLTMTLWLPSGNVTCVRRSKSCFPFWRRRFGALFQMSLILFFHRYGHRRPGRWRTSPNLRQRRLYPCFRPD